MRSSPAGIRSTRTCTSASPAALAHLSARVPELALVELPDQAPSRGSFFHSVSSASTVSL
jgi:hypothetical protein